MCSQIPEEHLGAMDVTCYVTLVLTMMSDLAAPVVHRSRLHKFASLPVNLAQSHFSHDGLCFIWIKFACPTDVAIESGRGRLMDDLQTPARAKILMA